MASETARVDDLANGDVLIAGGEVLDGTGAPPKTCDVLVRNGRIEAVGAGLEVSADAPRVDASGLTVAPGFIDVHTHYDNAVTWDGFGEHVGRQGVTTVVGGNCGGGRSDMAAHLNEVEAFGPAINYACLAGLNPIRNQVVGALDRSPTAEELDRMRGMAREALEAGAIGLSWGPYGASLFAQTDEVTELARVAADMGRLIAVHRRNERQRVIEATRETLLWARESGVQLQISHLKSAGREGKARFGEMLEIIEEARAEGLPVTCDAYPYNASGTGLNMLLPLWAKEGGRAKEVCADPANRDRLLEEIGVTLQDPSSPEHILTLSRDIEGVHRRTIADVARERGRTPAEMVIDLVLASNDGGGGPAIYGNAMLDEHQAEILRLPHCCVGSDAGVNIDEPPMSNHPRAFGTPAKVLRWSREGRGSALPEAIRKLTSLPAAIFGVPDRGLIAPGKIADITVFRADSVAERSTFEEPCQYPVGIEYVFVAGRPLIASGAKAGPTRGEVLRP